MELKPGYKQTEIGIIPDDWENGRLGNVVTKVGSGITPTGGNKVYKNEGRPFLRSQNVGWGVLLLDDIAFIDDETHGKFSDTEIEINDVFLNITGASIGRSSVSDVRVVNGNVNQHVCIIRTIPEKLNPRFLSYFLLSTLGQTQIDSFQAGGNRQGLNFGQIRSFLLPLPPLDEQRAIAAALSDIDAQINALDALIAKKRDIKQGTMQVLLTGEQRLPGFSGAWEKIPLKDVCWFQEGPGVRNTQFTQTGIKLLNGSNIFRGEILLENTQRYISEKEAFGAYSHFLVDAGDIVIASSGITVDKFDEKVAFVKDEHLPLCMNTSTIRFKARQDALMSSFLFDFLTSDSFKRQIGSQATGSAQLNFGPSHVAKTFVSLPGLGEQAAISTILSDMDAEITELEQSLYKTRALKQGMMHELLTGSTRLL